MKLRLFITAIIFLLIGEALFRLDNYGRFYEDKQVVKIKTSIEQTTELGMLEHHTIDTSNSSFRVMVLGDSYTYGGGIPFEDNFSQQLKLILQKANRRFKKIYVLDVTRPMSNTADQEKIYQQYAPAFSPNMVILGYNQNDIEGNLSLADTVLKKATSQAANPTPASFKQKIARLISNSVLLERTTHNAIAELKTFGYITPNSDLDKTLKTYENNGAAWQLVQQRISEIAADCRKNNCPLLFLRFPEVNMLDHPKLFAKTDKAIEQFASATPGIVFLNGAAVLQDESYKEYLLSPYDGHPNAKAHKKLARAAFTIIQKLPVSNNAF